MRRPRHCPRPDPRIDQKILRYLLMDIFRTLWICLLIVFRCAPAFALDSDRSIAQFHRTAWSENNGAPSEISALAQTEDGYLWIDQMDGSSDGWATEADTDSVATNLGVAYVDVATGHDWPGPIAFTFFWTESQTWESRDFKVELVDASRS